MDSNTVTVLTWSTEVFDTNNNFASNEFTPTVPGKYLFTASAYCQGVSAGYCIVYIYKNDIQVHEGSTVSTTGDEVSVVSAVVHMNGSTDNVKAYVYNQSNTISGIAYQTYFTGILVAPTAAVSGVWSISDVRFKENIATTTSGLGLLQRIPVYDFNLIGEADKRQQGFIAQKLYQYYPEAVTVGGENAFQSPWLVDYGRLTPLVVRAVQELNLKMEDLATTTPEIDLQPGSFVVRFYTALTERLIAWFADATNGIADLFATIIHAREGHFSDKVCVSDVCVSRDQLAAVLSATSQTSPSPSGQGNVPELAPAPIAPASVSTTTPEPSDAATSSPAVIESIAPIIDSPPLAPEEPEPTPTMTTAPDSPTPTPTQAQ